MNDKRYRYILYIITTVIIVTIGIQAYWNYKNYLSNKQQLIKDVQISLDKAVDDYYANLAEETTMGLTFDETSTDGLFRKNNTFSKILSNIDEKNGKINSIDSSLIFKTEGVKVYRGLEAKKIKAKIRKKENAVDIDSLKFRINKLEQGNPNTKLKDIKFLTSKILISITNDTLNLKAIDTLLKNELHRKKIDIDYNLNYKLSRTKDAELDDIILVKADSTNFNNLKTLTVSSKSTFLPKKSQLNINFTNETKVIFTRMLGGIGISTLLVFAVISCLFYLLKVINQQKQLAEVKNDLISNITHEFKTPIATISAALEGINSFNVIDDKEKTKKYIDISSNQLSKLNVMVEKLLETATLDSESLNLNKENTDISALIGSLSSKYQIQNPKKNIQTKFEAETISARVDLFHFENAINNILDNAIKYGGSTIVVQLKSRKNSIKINISDNGNSLNKANKERIFEKFYRIPKGNQHDVKGFGIGLYYTKSIIEKHGGHITLDVSNNLTTFKIEIPND